MISLKELRDGWRRGFLHLINDIELAELLHRRVHRPLDCLEVKEILFDFRIDISKSTIPEASEAVVHPVNADANEKHFALRRPHY